MFVESEAERRGEVADRGWKALIDGGQKTKRLGLKSMSTYWFSSGPAITHIISHSFYFCSSHGNLNLSLCVCVCMCVFQCVLHRQAGGNINDLYLWQRRRRRPHQYTPIRKTVQRSGLLWCRVYWMCWMCVVAIKRQRGGESVMDDNEQRFPFYWMCKQHQAPFLLIINGRLDRWCTLEKDETTFFVTFSHCHSAAASSCPL